jgi:hypothetical protein
VLRSDLVRVVVRGNRGRLIFARDEDLPVFSEVIKRLRPGLRLGEVLEELKPLRKIYDHKLVDGALEVALRHVELEETSPVSPGLIRQRLFAGGPALNDEERRARLKTVSAELGVDVERFMYSDLDIERVIVKAPGVDPRSLLAEYNREELEGLLLRSYSVTLEVSDNWKELLRSVKSLGLMYLARSRPLQVDVYGPVSLVKMTERYGRLVARLVPVLLRSSAWALRAQVAVGRGRRLIVVEVRDGDAEMPREQRREAQAFDSSVEEDLYRKLALLAKDNGWEVLREPEPLVTADGEIMIPDFGVRVGGSRAYIEVVGFWTREYVNNKLRKLSGLKERVLLVVNETLGVDAFRLTGHDVVTYRERINVAPIYEWLKRTLGRPSAGLPGELRLSGDYVSFEDVAKAYGVSADDVRGFSGAAPGYVKLRSYFVREGLLRALSSERLEGARLSQLASKYGPWVQEALQAMGYSLRWVGLSDAVVRKP